MSWGLLAQIITVIVAALGVFFLPSGVPTPVKRAGYAILGLIIIGGIIGLVDIFINNREKEKLRADLDLANDRIVNLSRTQLVTAAGILDELIDARVIFTGQQFARPIDGYLGPFPVAKSGIASVKVTFNVLNIVQAEFGFENHNAIVKSYEVIDGEKQETECYLQKENAVTAKNAVSAKKEDERPPPRPPGTAQAGLATPTSDANNSCENHKITNHFVSDASMGSEATLCFCQLTNRWRRLAEDES